jgi:indolepyruvate ferredoxin oxidoreductase, alpha subunit
MPKINEILGSAAAIAKGMGVHPDHVHLVQAHRKAHQSNVELLRKEIAYPGLSVIIPQRECIQTAKKA